MALLKDTDTRFGFTASYWRIISVYIHREQTHTTVDLVCYKDQDARNSGMAPVLTRQVHLDNLYVSEESCDLLAKAYGLIKNLPDFVGAEDE